MGSLNIATDILLIIIPLPMVFQARLPMARKIQLIILFGVSFFVVAITIIRMPVILHADSVQKARTLVCPALYYLFFFHNLITK